MVLRVRANALTTRHAVLLPLPLQDANYLIRNGYLEKVPDIEVGQPHPASRRAPSPGRAPAGCQRDKSSTERFKLPSPHATLEWFL